MGSFTPHRGTHCFISISERTTHPTHGLPHPRQGHTTFHLCLKEEPHTHLMGSPNSWASSPHTGARNVPYPSQRETTNPSHGHVQLMGSLSGRLSHSVSWWMSHAIVIINTNKLPTRSVFDLKLGLSFNCQARVCCCFMTTNC
jgi:hypothetical protein